MVALASLNILIWWWAPGKEIGSILLQNNLLLTIEIEVQIKRFFQAIEKACQYNTNKPRLRLA